MKQQQQKPIGQSGLQKENVFLTWDLTASLSSDIWMNTNPGQPAKIPCTFSEF